MSDQNYFDHDNPTVRLRVWAFGQMMWGAFLGAVALLAVVAVLVAIWAVGLLLPEESKQAPSPFSELELTQPSQDVV